MAELIDRQKVLDAFKQICDRCGKYKQNNGAMCRACYLDDAISIVDDIPSVVDTDLSGSSFRLYRAAYDRGKQEAIAESERQTRRWIPVTESVPKDRKIYLVTLDNNTTDFCMWNGSRWGFYGNHGWSECDEVIAWMPLPEPYQEGKND